MTTNKKEHCHANRDGDCRHKNCPQNRDKEPATSGRSCPLPNYEDEADMVLQRDFEQDIYKRNQS